MNLFINNDANCQRNKELLSILDEVINSKKFYILRGGLAIALYYNKIYRCHKDIDFYFDEQDFQFWVDFFSKKYKIKNSELPLGALYQMFEFNKNKIHMGHIIFIKNPNNKQNIIDKIYEQKDYSDMMDIIYKYSMHVPITKKDMIKAKQNNINPILEITRNNKKISILNINYLKEQKIFSEIYNNRKMDEDLMFYFNLE